MRTRHGYPALLLATLLVGLLFAGCDATEDEPLPEQSPMELPGAIVTVVPGGLPALDFDYDTDAELTVVNTGSPDHEATVRANVPVGGGTLTVSGVAYDLLQFHWHTPSEHRPLGETFPLEMHLVHRSQASDTLLVVGVLIEEGAENVALAPIFSDLPGEESEEVTVSAFDLNDLLPGLRTSLRYPGSLTTSPYTEGVKWVVLRNPIALSTGQIDAFQGLFPEHNTREEQEANGRVVLTDAPLSPAL